MSVCSILVKRYTVCFSIVPPIEIMAPFIATPRGFSSGWPIRNPWNPRRGRQLLEGLCIMVLRAAGAGVAPTKWRGHKMLSCKVDGWRIYRRWSIEGYEMCQMECCEGWWQKNSRLFSWTWALNIRRWRDAWCGASLWGLSQHWFLSFEWNTWNKGFHDSLKLASYFTGVFHGCNSATR